MSVSRSAQAEPYREAIKSGRWFSHLPEALQEGLLAEAQVLHLQQGERLFARGDAYDGIYCVLKGIFKTVGVNEVGKEAILTLLEPCVWFGEVALFDHLERTHDVIADHAGTVLRVPAEVLTRLLADNPGYWFWFGLLLSHKMRFAFIALEEVALLPAPLRIVRRLVLMAEGYGEWEDRSRRVLPLPQEQLASMLSVSRQTINQVLRQLEAQKLIQLHYRELEILDLEGLRKAGEISAQD